MLAGGPALATPTVLVVGDSLSTAYGIDQDEGWVALLEQRIAERGLPHRVVNASITGDTTTSGLGRMPRALRVHQPAAVIIELGGNDGLRGYPVERMRENLAGMIELARDAGAAVVLVGVSIPPNYGQDYRREFSAVYATLADEYDLPLVSFAIEDVATVPGMLQDDGIHPTAAAQSMMLDAIWPALAGTLSCGAVAVSAGR